MKPVKININDYVPSGEGANGLSYDNPSDPDEMLKMYNSGYEISAIETELEAARKVYNLGIPSPEPGDLVTDGERTGIRFKRIPHKTSFARAIADNLSLIEPLAKEFADRCRQFHSIKCQPGVFEDVKHQFLKLLEADTAFDAGQKEKIAAFIKSAPDSDTALHGDMHFGNIVISGPVLPQPGKERKVLWIDLGYFASGYHMFDLGMLYIVTHHADDAFIFENFHFHNDTAFKFWQCFLPEYFGTTDPEILKQKEYECKCFAAIKTLLIEYNCGNVLFPHFKKLFMETILKQ
ncbi:MAG: phosphotransferase [Bacteroidales bacterium]|nr:phosphotransferase [Bacteroidales bacterium]